MAPAPLPSVQSQDWILICQRDKGQGSGKPTATRRRLGHWLPLLSGVCLMSSRKEGLSQTTKKTLPLVLAFCLLGGRAKGKPLNSLGLPVPKASPGQGNNEVREDGGLMGLGLGLRRRGDHQRGSGPGSAQGRGSSNSKTKDGPARSERLRHSLTHFFKIQN